MSEVATAGAAAPPLVLACPACRAPLVAVGPTTRRCPAEGTTYERRDGIWRLLAPGRAAAFARFIQEYETVRQAEGRGADDPAYYRALPFTDQSGRFAADWRIRALSYRALLTRVVAPLVARRGRPLTVLDLGAGNGWLAYRLAQRGHVVAAVDLLTNARDGLGAHVHYDAAFQPMQAEFDRLPVATDQADLVIFNGAFHYSPDYRVTLTEALRVLRPDGQVVIMDSPIYRDPTSGARMVREREAAFQRAYGFPSNALASEGYLSEARLAALAADLGLRWRPIAPCYGWRWALRPWWARLRGHREPARFLVLVGTRDTLTTETQRTLSLAMLYDQAAAGCGHGLSPVGHGK